MSQTIERKPREIQREMEETRQGMRSKLRRLEEELSPDALIDRAVGYFKGDGDSDDMFGEVLGVIRDNPVPTALAVASVLWLVKAGRARQDDEFDDAFDDAVDTRPMRALPPPRRGRRPAQGRRPVHRPQVHLRPATAPTTIVTPPPVFDDFGASDDSGGIGETFADLQDSAEGKLEAVVDKARSAVDRAKGALSSGGSAVSDGAGEVADQARDLADGARSGLRSAADSARSTWQDGTAAASEWVDAAGDRYDEIQRSARRKAKRGARRTRRQYDRNPLVFGLAAIAAGAAIGALLPPTRHEDELMGEESDALTEQAKEKAAQVAEKAGDAAAAGIEAAGDAVGDVVETVREAADEARAAALDAAERGDGTDADHEPTIETRVDFEVEDGGDIEMIEAKRIPPLPPLPRPTDEPNG